MDRRNFLATAAIRRGRDPTPCITVRTSTSKGSSGVVQVRPRRRPERLQSTSAQLRMAVACWRLVAEWQVAVVARQVILPVAGFC